MGESRNGRIAPSLPILTILKCMGWCEAVCLKNNAACWA